ncbi:MAG: hypothetical protein ACQSGP_17945 [Frankia sp.]
MELSGGSETRSPAHDPASAGFRQKVLVDRRGAGLRVTWHPEAEICVLSIWRGDVCVGTFRLPIGEVADLSGFLSSVLSDWSLDVLADRAASQVQPPVASSPAADRPGTSMWDRLRRAGVALRKPSPV